MPVSARYSTAQILLHWTIAVLIVVNWFLGDGMGWALKQKVEGHPLTGIKISLHVWIGVAVLVLVLIRLVLRLTQGAPALLGHGILDRLAEWMHWVLYALMIVGPLLGAISWFQNIPPLAEPHALLMNILLWLAGLHALAALYHQFILKDGLLSRMRPM